MTCSCGHSGFYHAGLEGFCRMEGCKCDSYYEEYTGPPEEDKEDFDEEMEPEEVVND